MPIQVTGVEAILRAMSKARKQDAINMQEGMRKCAEVVLRKAQYYVPVATGNLKASGAIVIEGSGWHTRASVEFGGPGAYYAIYVHEDLQAQHASPTSAKYLERAVRETRGTCASIMAREMGAKIIGKIDGEEQIL